MATRIYLPTEPLFDAGEGYPIVVLHGSLYNFFSWMSLLRYFSQTHRVMIPRLPLYSNALMNIRIDDIVNYLHSFVQAYAIRKFICIGSGYGAYIALHYTKQFSDTLSQLILTRPFDVLSGLVSSTLLDEKIGNRHDMRVCGDRVFDKFSTASSNGIFHDDEMFLKDAFFRLCPFAIPATLIVDGHSFTSAPNRELQIDVHSNPFLSTPGDLILPVTKFLARQ